MRKPPIAHIYEHTEPGKQVTIVANKNGLSDLSKALNQASDVGFGTVKLYSGDGHEYNVIVCKESEDEVLENLEVPYTSSMFKENRDEYVDKDNLEFLNYYKKSMLME
tara:strand:+ start:323 stop:646 length:324 start_codon:yes stop_codon:yes gene_type:complete